MTEAETAFAAAEAEIAAALADRSHWLSFDKEQLHALESLPDSIGHLSDLTILDLDKTKVSDLTPLSGLTALRELGLDHVSARDLRPLIALQGLTENPRGLGLTFNNCGAAQNDPKIAEFAEIR